VITPAGTAIHLAVKIAVTAGAARRFLVGDPEVQRIDVLAGRIVDELAAAEHQAQKGEVVLHSSALEALAIASRSASFGSRKTTGGSSVSPEASPCR